MFLSVLEHNWHNAAGRRLVRKVHTDETLRSGKLFRSGVQPFCQFPVCFKDIIILVKDKDQSGRNIENILKINFSGRLVIQGVHGCQMFNQLGAASSSFLQSFSSYCRVPFSTIQGCQMDRKENGLSCVIFRGSGWIGKWLNVG